MEKIIDVLIPIYAVAGLGFLFGRKHLLPDRAEKALSEFVFQLSLPALIFANIVSSDIRQVFDLRFIVVFAGSEALAAGISYLYYRYIRKMSGKPLILQVVGGVYSNTAFVGIPLFTELYGNTAPLSMGILLHNIYMVPPAIFFLDLADGKEGTSFRSTLIKSLKSPMIFSTIAAILLLICGVKVPPRILSVFELLGKPSTATAIFTLGLSIGAAQSIRLPKEEVRSLIEVVACKLLLVAAFAGVLGTLLRLEEPWQTWAVISAMLPTAMNVYILSEHYESHTAVSRLNILISTLLFSVTLLLYMAIRQ